MNKLHALLLSSSLLAAATAAASAEAPADTVARGRYLVENVIGCADCHSQRDQRGQIVAATHLMGATLPFAPTVPMPAWGATAPAIVDVPGYTDAQAVTLLMHGTKPDGQMPRPPMPQFRLNEEDARAVVAYLRSLKK
jgi:mono/diheme cytochrome c family protein